MSLITKTYTFTAGATIVAAEHNSNFDTIYNDYNGNITNANISGSAAISDSKLAQIVSPSKVTGDALTSLANIPSGAGLIPVANIDTGTTADKIVQLTAAAKLPAVDGSLLTGITQGNLSSILNYGTSASSSSSVTQTTLKVAYGTINISGSANQAITNLPFTSTASYSMIGTFALTNSATEAIVIIRNSASQATIYNNDNLAQDISWFAIGT